jgi:hypothetical protein
MDLTAILPEILVCLTALAVIGVDLLIDSAAFIIFTSILLPFFSGRVCHHY